MSGIQSIQSKKKKSTPKTAKTPQEKFHLLWQSIEKANKSLDKNLKDRNNMVARFNESLLPLEQILNQKRYDFVEHLLNFYAKKSLSAAYKEDTLQWVDELRNEIMESPFRGDLDMIALDKRIYHAFSSQNPTTQDQYDAIREHLCDEYGINKDWTDEELDELLKDPSKLSDIFEEWHNQSQQASHEQPDTAASQAEESAQTHQQHSQHDHQHEYEPQNKAALSTLSTGFINRCYKKLAHVFHPDRASEALQDDAQTLMGILSTAKKEQDIFTILDLYQKYVNDAQFGFDDAEIEQLNTLLSSKLAQINAEKRRIRWEDGLNSWIYGQFRGTSKRAVNAHFENYQHNLNQEIAGITNTMSALTSLKHLREQLQARRYRFLPAIDGDMIALFGEDFFD